MLAGKVWRVGLMGTSCTQANVDLCLDVLGALVPEAAARCPPEGFVEAPYRRRS